MSAEPLKPSSPWSARPRRARPGSRSTSPSASTARSSTPTRWRSTAAWTSAPPSCPGRVAWHPAPPARSARRDRAADRGGVPGLGPRGDRRGRGRGADPGAGGRVGALHPGGARPVRVPGHRPRGTTRGSRPSSRTSAPLRSTAAWPRSTPRRLTGSCPTTAAGSCVPSRSSRSPGGPTAPRFPSMSTSIPPPCRSVSTSTAPRSTRGSSSGCGRCSTAGFVEEVRRLLGARTRGGPHRPTAIGYREVASYLAGEPTLEEAVEATAARDPALLPATGRLVPQGPARRLGARGTTPSASSAQPRRRGRRGRHPLLTAVPEPTRRGGGTALVVHPGRDCHTGAVSYPFLKGHGTENDFVLLPDHDGSVHGELPPDASGRSATAGPASAVTASCA